jgi:hypothetical protein
VGIGAQRAGTTWFTELLQRHPEVVGPDRPGARGKEFHAFDRFGAEPWSDADGEAYRALFPADKAAGEFTPAYLRCPWVPSLLRRATPDDVLLFVLLRDPVERYRSALRWAASGAEGLPARTAGAAADHAAERRVRQWARSRGSDASWGGLYAAQLDLWAAVFPRDRIHVVQYERLVADPAGEMSRAWRALGLDPARARGSDGAAAPAGTTARDTSVRTWNATTGGAGRSGAPVPAEAPGLVASLRRLYAPDAARCAAAWGIDPALWTTTLPR